jgi:hypothetical protein
VLQDTTSAYIKYLSTLAGWRLYGAARPGHGQDRLQVLADQPAKQNAVLQREQLQAWFTAVRAIRNPLISAYLQMMILAGSRPNEPLWLKWQDVNFQWKTITIRDKVVNHPSFRGGRLV